MRAIKITLEIADEYWTSIYRNLAFRHIIIILQHTVFIFLSHQTVHNPFWQCCRDLTYQYGSYSVNMSHVFVSRYSKAAECILYLMIRISRDLYIFFFLFFFFFTSTRSHFVCNFFFSLFIVYALISRTDARTVFSRSSVFSHFHFLLREKLTLKAQIFRSAILYIVYYSGSQRWRGRVSWGEANRGGGQIGFALCILRAHIASYHNGAVKRRYTSAKKFLSFARLHILHCAWVAHRVGGNRCEKLIKARHAARRRGASALRTLIKYR